MSNRINNHRLLRSTQRLNNTNKVHTTSVQGKLNHDHTQHTSEVGGTMRSAPTVETGLPPQLKRKNAFVLLDKLYAMHNFICFFRMRSASGVKYPFRIQQKENEFRKMKTEGRTK